MSYLRFLARRIVFSLVSVYLVITATFLLVNLMLWRRLHMIVARARYGGASPEEIERIRQGFMEQRGLDTPILERFVTWTVDATTLTLGESRIYEEPIASVLARHVQTTLEYVIPGVILAISFGVLLGLVAALTKGSVVDWTSRLGSYVLLGIPAFMTVVYILFLGGARIPGLGKNVVFPVLSKHTIAALAVAISLLAGQIRFVRSAVLDQMGEYFVKMLRAKGAGRLRMARHILRNASIQIVSLSVTELLGVLMLNIYVLEDVLGISGLAEVSLRAVRAPDIRLAIWAAMVLVFIGIAGNLIQDILYGYLDPRIEANL